MRQNFSVPPRQICKQVRLLQNCDFCSKLCLKWNQGTEAELVYGIWETELVLGKSLSVCRSGLFHIRFVATGPHNWSSDLAHRSGAPEVTLESGQNHMLANSDAANWVTECSQ